MKILHLIDSGGLYGAEKMLLALVAEQLKMGLQPMILSAGAINLKEKPLETEAKKMNLPITIWRMKPGLNLFEAKKILLWANSKGYDILHSHGYKFNILMGIWPYKLRKIPLISTLHGYVNAQRFSKMWLYEVLDRLVLNRMEAVVLVADKMRQIKAIKNLPKARVRSISNGISTDTNDASLILKSRPDIMEFTRQFDFLLLLIGRLSPEKSIDTALSALAHVARQHKSIGLCIMGTGGLEDELKLKAQSLGLTQHVYFAGYVDNAAAFMPSFNALLMPSLTEGLPITLLEAMKAKVPVIASRVGGIPEALDNGSCGYLIDPASIDGLTKAIIQVMSEPEKTSNLTEQAWAMLQSKFSASSMSRRYFEVYNFALKQKDSL